MSTELGQGAGYGIVLGLGIGFAAIMIGISKIQTRYTSHSLQSSEEFTSASRSLNPGILASGIVSAATWAATLLNSSTVTYLYGISGCYWYGAGSVSQIMLFAQNAVQIKRNAPGAHTFLEVIKLRWGTVPHAIFIFYGLGTNILLTSQLICGGSESIVYLTGMSIYAACILIPATVVAFTVVGGLRSTFLSDYIHTTLIFAIITAFMFSVYASNPQLGSPSKVYDMLQAAAVSAPLEGNAGGSYTTFRSINGLVFGIIVVISGITTVFMDQSYWQRAIASKASTSMKGYLYGGFAFMPVPYGFATACAIGLVALGTPVTNPSNVATIAASVILGKSGATLLLITLFLAIGSAASAELVAVSTIFVYDIYKPYFHSRASDKRILLVSHIAVGVYGVIMALLGIIFYEIGISLSWLYGLTGVMFSCAVVPVGFAIRSSTANKWGCTIGSFLGFICAICAWIGTAKGYYGVLNVNSTGGNYPQLAGNAAGIFISGACCLITTQIWPEKFDFEITRRHNFGADDVAEVHAADLPLGTTSGAAEDKKEPVASNTSPLEASDDVLPETNLNDASEEQLARDFKFSVWATLVSFVVLCIIVPAFACIPRIWSKAGFTVWIVITFLWVAASIVICVFWPLIEARDSLGNIGYGIYKDLTGRSRAPAS